MPRSDWRLYTAIGCVALLACVIGWVTWPRVPTLRTYSAEQPRTGDYRPGGYQCNPKALAAIRDQKVASDKRIDCQKQTEEYRLNTNDLIQQTRAADAAEAQAQVASQGLWTAWLQSLGGFLTLCAAVAAAIYARDAAKHTKRGADVAKDALDDSRTAAADQAIALNRQLELARQSIDASIGAQRPWMALRAEFREIPSIDPVGGWLRVNIRINAVNLGKNPAIKLRVGTRMEPFIMENGDGNWLELARADAIKAWSNHAIVFPGEAYEITGYGGPAPAADFVLYACVAYKIDGSDEDHFTGIAFRVNDITLDKLPSIFAQGAGIVS